MSKTKEWWMEKYPFVRGDGAGLKKIRVRCVKCKSLIDYVDKPCSKCGCVVFY